MDAASASIYRTKAALMFRIPHMKKGYLYILRCANGQYYTGSTTDLAKRLAQHHQGEAANFTRRHRPVELVYAEEFAGIEEAFAREKQVQGWSRQKKEALIRGRYGTLPRLSKSRSLPKRRPEQ